MLLIITIVIFITMLTVVVIGYRYATTPRREVADRVGRYVKAEQELVPAQPNPPLAPDVAGWRSLVRRLSRYFESPQWTRLVEHKLTRAGILLRASEFLVICFGAALVCGLILFFLTRGKGTFALLGAVCGYWLPFLVLRVKIGRRTKAFNEQLGDALILIANSLRTGYSFLQSIDMVAREMPAPISQEFARVLKEMNLGVTTEDALNNLAKRVNSDDLDLVVTAVLIQRQVGGNLAEVLNNIANTIRGRIRIKGEIKTLTAQGRMSGLVVGCLPFGLGVVLYIMNPEYIKVLFSHPAGQVMLGVALTSQMLGIMIIRKIVNIDV